MQKDWGRHKREFIICIRNILEGSLKTSGVCEDVN